MRNACVLYMHTNDERDQGTLYLNSGNWLGGYLKHMRRYLEDI